MENIFLKFWTLGKNTPPNPWMISGASKRQRLYYIKGGTGWYIAEDSSRMQLLPGKIYLFPYNLKVNFEHRAEDPISHIFFDFLTTPPIIAQEPLVYDVEPDSPTADVIAAFDHLFVENPAKLNVFGSISDAAPGGADERRQIYYSLFKTLLLMLSEIRPLPFQSDAVISETLAYIHTHYTEKIGVQTLASMAGYDTNYFIRRFRNAMGTSPYAYLRAYRLMLAEEWIAGGMTVEQAASMVGYETPSSLSRALHKEKVPME